MWMWCSSMQVLVVMLKLSLRSATSAWAARCGASPGRTTSTSAYASTFPAFLDTHVFRWVSGSPFISFTCLYNCSIAFVLRDGWCRICGYTKYAAGSIYKSLVVTVMWVMSPAAVLVQVVHIAFYACFLRVFCLLGYEWISGRIKSWKQANFFCWKQSINIFV
jgi:hypothetical protein